MSSDVESVSSHICLLLVLIAVVFISSRSRPQLKAEPLVSCESGLYTFRTKVQAVLVDVAVTDRENQPITGLQPLALVGPTTSSVPTPAASVSAGQNSSAISALRWRELEPADIPKYCTELARNQKRSSSLTNVCEYVFNLRKMLVNVVCDREAKRYWTAQSTLVGLSGENDTGKIQHADVVTAHVTYRDGQEYYSDSRVDGRPVAANSPELSGNWTQGEFATMLGGIFSPSSKTQFHYSKSTKLHSIPALVFDFKVTAQNNRVFFMQYNNSIWFPEYGGSVWVDERTSSLIRLRLEADMPGYGITRMKDEIEYSNVLLGDGSSMVLPTRSSVLICGVDCARSIITFRNWHKFRATTNIVEAPSN